MKTRSGVRDIIKLIREAKVRGWTASRTNKCHWRLQHSSGAIVFMAGSSDARAFQNAKAELKRAERRIAEASL